MKIIRILAVLAVIGILAIPTIVSAISPSATAVLQGDTNVKLDWTISVPQFLSITNNTIKKSIDSFPLSRTDSNDVLIYSGAATTYTDDISGNIDLAKFHDTPLTIYYSIWTKYLYGYSTATGYLTVGMGDITPISTGIGSGSSTETWSDAENVSVDIGGSSMTNSIMLIGIMIVSLFMSAMGYYFKKVPITVIACLLWLGTGAWSFTQVVTSYDIYFVIGCVGVLMGILSAVEPFIWVVMEKKKALTPEEQEAEIDRQNQKEFEESMSNKKRKRRPY